MKPRRLALITRRFWPLVGGAERAMAGLAHEFQAMGQSVRVLTGKWESQWPTEIVHREVPVTRLPCPKTRGWGTFRYMSGLKRWLWQHQDNFDAVLVSMLKHDAHVAVKALSRLAKPVIIRAEGSGATGDCAFHETARFGGIMKKTCMKADAIIAPSEKVSTELLASGFDQDRLHFIPNGVEVT
ncbi:MAG: glycosyltransferase family 4 protein, partial [Planctomycetota bacterium]|nr:glycosyltransferase family 4 protein [Planctomycetota bacterium]